MMLSTRHNRELNTSNPQSSFHFLHHHASAVIPLLHLLSSCSSYYTHLLPCSAHLVYQFVANANVMDC